MKPAVAFAMPNETFHRVFSMTELDRIRDASRLLQEAPFESFDDATRHGVLAEAEVLVTGWGTPLIDDAVLDRMPRLRAIVHAAGSVKHHIGPSCWARGVAVTSAAEANALPVAEYTVAMILLSGKNILQVAQETHDRRTTFTPDVLFPRMGNYHKRIGIVGASKIGRKVIELLRPYDLHVVVADPYLPPADAQRLGVELVDLAELLATCDVVSLHAPSVQETHHLIDAAGISSLLPGATLINTSRGELIDQDVLVERVGHGDLFAILDVTTPWTLPPDHPFYDNPNVLLTPHIAGSLGNELTRLAEAAADEVERIADGRPPAHPVDAATLAITA